LFSLTAFGQTKTTTAVRSAATNANTATISTNKPMEKVEAIKPPKDPLPVEADSVHVNQFSFIVYGDTRGRRDGKEVQYEHSLIVDSMLANIKKLSVTPYPVRFVLQTGDAVVNGRDPKQWNKSFVTLINRITTEGRVPYFLAPGNHDVTAAQDIGNAQRNEGLTNYLQAVAQLIPPNGAHRRLDGFPCYAFGYGNSFFIALDSNLASNKTQLAWVTNQIQSLDRTRYTNLFVFFHHPPYSSGPHGGANLESATAWLRTNYMPVFRKYHATALFAGHEHFFEHWVERYQDAATNKFRIDVIVTGGGGAPLYGHRGEPKLTDYIADDKRAKIVVDHLVRPGPKPGDNPYHYVIVRVDGSTISFEVVGVDWGAEFKPYQSNRFSPD
jgi:3',5'-cyclic AMP phosphodiesterase CpdA